MSQRSTSTRPSFPCRLPSSHLNIKKIFYVPAVLCLNQPISISISTANLNPHVPAVPMFRSKQTLLFCKEHTKSNVPAVSMSRSKQTQFLKKRHPQCHCPDCPRRHNQASTTDTSATSDTTVTFAIAPSSLTRVAHLPWSGAQGISSHQSQLLCSTHDICYTSLQKSIHRSIRLLR